MSRQKALILLLVVALIATLSLAGCSGGQKTDLDKIKAAKQMLFGTDNTYPPMEYTDENGTTIGFDIDLVNEIATRIGVKCVIVPSDWSGLLPGLNAGKYDAVISSMNITEERLKEVAFSDPYVAMGQVIIVHKDTTNISKLEDLVGKIIAVQQGTTNEEAAKNIPGVKDSDIKRFNTFADAFTELMNKKADAVIADEPVGRYYMAQKPDVYKVVGEPFEKAPMGIALRKADVKLIEAVNKALADMRSDGTFDTISKKWFGNVVPNK